MTSSLLSDATSSLSAIADLCASCARKFFQYASKDAGRRFGYLSRGGVGITTFWSGVLLLFTGKGGKNRRRGKNESEEKRELIFKEDGQGANRRSWPALILPASSMDLGASSAGYKRCPRGGIGGIEAL